MKLTNQATDGVETAKSNRSTIRLEKKEQHPTVPKNIEEEIRRSIELRTTQNQLKAAIERENALKAKNSSLEQQMQNMKL